MDESMTRHQERTSSWCWVYCYTLIKRSDSMSSKMVLSYHPPVFSTKEEERQHLKQKLAASFRLFSKFGFDEGVAGHITARDPELKDHFWVNPFGMHFSQIK